MKESWEKFLVISGGILKRNTVENPRRTRREEYRKKIIWKKFLKESSEKLLNEFRKESMEKSQEVEIHKRILKGILEKEILEESLTESR